MVVVEEEEALDEDDEEGVAKPKREGLKVVVVVVVVVFCFCGGVVLLWGAAERFDMLQPYYKLQYLEHTCGLWSEGGWRTKDNVLGL